MGLRIISGALKGKKLYSVHGTITRPTADRLRESVFNIITNKTNNAFILDLFAGTGAFGIEALSRGAAFACFIEKYKAPLTVIQKNISACSLENRSKIIRWDIKNNLNCIKSARPSFDLVFMDPPYNRKNIDRTLLNLAKSKAIADGALIIIEHSPSEPVLDSLNTYHMIDQRTYGKTIVSFLQFNNNQIERTAV